MEKIEWEKLDWQMEPENGDVRFSTTFLGIKCNAHLRNNSWTVDIETPCPTILMDDISEDGITSSKLDETVRRIVEKYKRI